MMPRHRSRDKHLARLLCQCALLFLIFAATMVVGVSCGQKVEATQDEATAYSLKVDKYLAQKAKAMRQCNWCHG